MSRYYHYETFGNKALGHVNIFELRDVCGVELFDFEGIKISGYLNSEKVTHIIYFWLKRIYRFHSCYQKCTQTYTID